MYILVRVGDHIAQPIMKRLVHLLQPIFVTDNTVNTDKEANNMSQALERIIGKLRYIAVLILIVYTYRNTGLSIHRYVVLV